MTVKKSGMILCIGLMAVLPLSAGWLSQAKAAIGEAAAAVGEAGKTLNEAAKSLRENREPLREVPADPVEGQNRAADEAADTLGESGKTLGQAAKTLWKKAASLRDASVFPSARKQGIFYEPQAGEDSEGFYFAYAVEPFRELSVSGAFDVHVRRGNDYSLKIYPSEPLKKQLRVGKDKEELIVFTKKTIKGAGKPAIWGKIEVTAPTLDEYETRGVVNTLIEGFTQDQLEIDSHGSDFLVLQNTALRRLTLDLKGASQVVYGKPSARQLKSPASLMNGEDPYWKSLSAAFRETPNPVPIDLLEIETEGTISVDLSAVPVRTVEAEIEGVSSVRLKTEGGTVSGSVDGMSTLQIDGWVSDSGRLSVGGAASFRVNP